MNDAFRNGDLDARDREAPLHPTTHPAPHQRGELAGRNVGGGRARPSATATGGASSTPSPRSPA